MYAQVIVDLQHYHTKKHDKIGGEIVEIYIVFEYADHTNKIVGCYKKEKDAKKKHEEAPMWRYVEKQIVL